MIPLLIDAARSMDAIFWRQAYGNRDSLLQSITDPATRRYAEINYGPWDRLDNNAPFIEGVGPQADGRRLLPSRYDQRGVRGRGQAVAQQARRCGASTPWCGGTRPVA